MEQKLVRVPFEVELAKKITNGDVDGKIVTRDGGSARVVCWDVNDRDDYVLALLSNDNREYPVNFLPNGRLVKDEEKQSDLMLEIPEYMTFKDGDVIVCGNENCSWISVIKSLKSCADGIVTTDYVSFVTKGIADSDRLLSFEMFTNAGKWARLATEAEKQTMVNALKESKEPIAKEYLKRFFGIEAKLEYEFKPFDRVLVRDEGGIWFADIFSHYTKNSDYEYKTAGGGSWEYCIPYNEQTAHLLGTTDNWEE